MLKEIKDLVVGDHLTRILGTIHLPVVVTKIEEGIITVQSSESREEQIKIIEGGRRVVEMLLGVKRDYPPITELPDWTFSTLTGREIDEDLKWDGIRTGSYLVIENEDQ